MRLLKRDGDKLAFEVANETAFTVPYAVLSHTWNDIDEVTYQDLLGGRRNRKIDFTLNQAAHDGVHHVWIDTCCIDKTSSAEMSESINLMWKWYANAQVCYAYLYGPIEGNRWFTRGWTLQELIAPRKVVFYTDERRLGTRDDLVEILHQESKIEHAVLKQQQSFKQISFADRYQWVVHRQTKKEEDLVYCLLGLFEVGLVLNYGVGLQHVQYDFLEKIERQHGRPAADQLRLSMQINSRDLSIDMDEDMLMKSLRFRNMASRRENIKMPVPGTCDWILDQAEYKRWHKSSEGLFWIKGHAGSGKSVLVKFIDERSKSAQALHISFYFNARGSILERSTEGLFRSLLAQLLDRSSDLQSVVMKYLKETHRGPAPIWSLELLQHILSMTLNLTARPVRCFVDALDECDIAEVKAMIQFFELISQQLTQAQFRVCFASRHYPTLSINGCIQLLLEQKREHTLAIELYIERTLHLEPSDFGRSICQQLTGKARGVFIWAVLVVQRLNAELDRGRVVELQALVKALPEELNDVYHALLMKTENDEEFKLCMQLVQYCDPPLTAWELYYAVLYGVGRLSIDVRGHTVPTQDLLKRFVTDTSRGLAEMVKDTSSAQFVHESVRDFLIDGEGLSRLLSIPQVDVASASHSNIASILARYINELRVRLYSDRLWQSGRERLDDDRLWKTGLIGDQRLLDPIEHIREARDLRVPLLPAVASRLLSHANYLKQDSDKEAFLRGLDWEGFISAEIIIDFSPSFGFRPHAVGSLVRCGALSLFRFLVDLHKLDWTHRLLGPCPVVEVGALRHDESVKYLVERGFSVDQTDDDGNTALVRSISRRHTQTTLLLLELGANVSIESDKGATPLIQACGWEIANQTIIEALIQRGADINGRGDSKYAQDTTPLIEMCRGHTKHANCAVITTMLQAGADVNSRACDGSTALICTSDYTLSKMLLQEGADVNAMDDKDDTAMSEIIRAALTEPQTRSTLLWCTTISDDSCCCLRMVRMYLVTSTIIDYFCRVLPNARLGLQSSLSCCWLMRAKAIALETFIPMRRVHSKKRSINIFQAFCTLGRSTVCMESSCFVAGQVKSGYEYLNVTPDPSYKLDI